MTPSRWDPPSMAPETFSVKRPLLAAISAIRCRGNWARKARKRSEGRDFFGSQCHRRAGTTPPTRRDAPSMCSMSKPGGSVTASSTSSSVIRTTEIPIRSIAHPSPLLRPGHRPAWDNRIPPPMRGFERTQTIMLTKYTHSEGNLHQISSGSAVVVPLAARFLLLGMAAPVFLDGGLDLCLLGHGDVVDRPDQ